MAKFKIGDRVRVKDRKDWPTPPGYRLANTEGKVVKICEWDEVIAEFPECIKIEVEKTKADFAQVGAHMFFREDSLEKI
jgi:hypothetical protein